jgi:hypothetical protein
MPRGDCTFRKRDLKVAVEAVQEAGAKLARVVIKHNGDIVLQMQAEGLPVGENAAVTGEPEPGPPREKEPNEWDVVLPARPS